MSKRCPRCNEVADYIVVIDSQRSTLATNWCRRCMMPFEEPSDDPDEEPNDLHTDVWVENDESPPATLGA